MEIPGYTANSDPEEDEEDPKEDPADQPADGGDNDDNESSDDDDDDVEKDEEDEKEEEEHLALADPSVVLIDDHVPSRISVEEIERVIAQRVANAIKAIAIYEIKTNMAHKLMSQTEQQEDKVAKNASNKRKCEGNHNGSSSQQNKGHKVPREHITWPIKKKAYAESLPLCNQCKFHHNGSCTAVVVCDEKIVRVPFENKTLIIHDDRINRANETRLNIISCTKTQKYVLKGCQIFLAYVTTKETEDKSEKKRLEDVPIIQDFPDVLHEDLPSLPSTQEVEFQIDLIPGDAPVARAITSFKYGKRIFQKRLSELDMVIMSSKLCHLVWEYTDGIYGSREPRERAKWTINGLTLVMTIGLDLPKQILNAQTEARKSENLKNKDVGVPLDGLHFDDKLHIVEEPVEIMD
nr:reverse transcriptase domain-containing protein [Tanacetum cinerariifolium]